MISQTDFSVTCGFISIGVGAVTFYRLTGITKWIAFPLGAVLGFLIVTIIIYLLISVLAKFVSRIKNKSPDN